MGIFFLGFSTGYCRYAYAREISEAIAETKRASENLGCSIDLFDRTAGSQAPMVKVGHTIYKESAWQFTSKE